MLKENGVMEFKKETDSFRILKSKDQSKLNPS
jgi:hypothetical protein